MIDENVKAYLVSILAHGINLDLSDRGSIDRFAVDLVSWYSADVDDLEFTGDGDGVLCQRDGEIFVHMTFISGHMKFHMFDPNLLDNLESSNLVVKIVLSTVGFCQHYFDELPIPKASPVTTPAICPGSEEEIISVKDDGFGIV